jgi:uncharacterized membrane protein
MGLRLLTHSAWTLVAIGAALVCLYGVLVYFILPPGRDSDLGIDAFFEHRLALRLHILGSAIALAIGPIQLYLRRLMPLSRRASATKWHRRLGRIYVGAVLFGVGFGFYIAFYADAGIIAQAGFVTLAIATLATTLLGLFAIRRGDEAEHRVWMARSFALIFAAVTLRLYIPFLFAAFGEDNGYRIVAWLCWVPNLVVAEYMLRRSTPIPATATSG